MQQYDETAIRQRLNDERAQIESDIYARTQGDQVVTPVDPISDAAGVQSYEADDADAMSDTERNQAITRNDDQLLEQVNAAIGRLDAGTYGTCVRCGQAIDARRLEALPYATLCITCQEAVENGAPIERG